MLNYSDETSIIYIRETNAVVNTFQFLYIKFEREENFFLNNKHTITHICKGFVSFW